MLILIRINLLNQLTITTWTINMSMFTQYSTTAVSSNCILVEKYHGRQKPGIEKNSFGVVFFVHG